MQKIKIFEFVYHSAFSSCFKSGINFNAKRANNREGNIMNFAHGSIYLIN